MICKFYASSVDPDSAMSDLGLHCTFMGHYAFTLTVARVQILDFADSMVYNELPHLGHWSLNSQYDISLDKAFFFLFFLGGGDFVKTNFLIYFLFP